MVVCRTADRPKSDVKVRSTSFSANLASTVVPSGLLISSELSEGMYIPSTQFCLLMLMASILRYLNLDLMTLALWSLVV